MIITRTPLRLSLGGGGTDLPTFYKKFGGRLISATINKYVYVIIRNNFNEGIRFTGYHNKETVKKPQQIQHPVVKAALCKMKEFKNIKNRIEIVTLSDLPANSGLGGSSSFIVGLLNALYTFIGKKISKKILAEKALLLERKILRESGGVQDQYIASFGGFKVFKISKIGKVKIKNLKIKYNIIKNLEKELLVFNTGVYRFSSGTQKKTEKKLLKKNNLQFLKEIKEIGKKNINLLKNGNLDSYGIGMNRHWELKKKYGDGITNKQIDRLYKIGINNGSLGGKIIGAGNGGFIMFHVPQKKNKFFKKVFQNLGLVNLKYKFTNHGSQIIYREKNEKK